MILTRFIFITLLACCVLSGGENSIQAKEPNRPGMYMIFDGSNSMWGELPDTSRKITVAKQAAKEFFAGEFENNVKAYERKGKTYDRPVSTIKAGEEKEIILRARN